MFLMKYLANLFAWITIVVLIASGILLGVFFWQKSESFE